MASIDFPPAGEHVELDLDRDRAFALEACLAGQYDRACEILKRWDVLLARQGELHEWFDVRLRLAAACRLSDREQDFERLGSELQLRATEARDWLTIRRLNRLRTQSASVSPLATAEGAVPGRSASLATSAPPPAHHAGAPETDQTAPVVAQQHEAIQWAADVSKLMEQLPSTEDENFSAGAAAVVRQLMALAPVAQSDREAGLLLHTVRSCARGCAALSNDVWNWAQRISAPFGYSGNVVSLLASLADSLMAAAEEGAAVAIAPEHIEKLHRTAMDLEPDNAGVFSRAGWHYLLRENEGEAERCLSRGFRLDRTNAYSVLQLARIYQQSNRGRDALAAFDLALREGCENVGVAWQASIAALDEGQYMSCLLYLDKYESLQPGLPWVSYFRALALLELGRFEEGRASAESEHARCSEHAWAADVLSACAAAGMNQIDETRAFLALVLGADWGKIDYLTARGLARLVDLLWRTIAKLDATLEPLAAQLDDRLLASGLAPDALFERARLSAEKSPDVNFYRCTIRQPLYESWRASPARLHGQADWRNYTVTWGVLAHSEEDGTRMALDWQRRCYPLDAVVESVEQQGSGYLDVPGVVWQSRREAS